MGGGLMQLVAYGAQDVYLTGNPQITFFKVVYRRHTNFSMEAVEQTFNGQPGFGRRVTCTISRNGDLVHKMYLRVTVPELNADGAKWAPSLGEALVKSVELEIGGQRVDKHYGDWLHIWNELSLTEEKRGAYDEMIGNVARLTNAVDVDSTDAAADYYCGSSCGDISGGTPDANTDALKCAPQTDLYIPLQFWFNRNPGLALPLIALQYHEVKLNVEFENKAALVAGGEYGDLVKADLLVDYIFLDTDERRRFAQVSHEYLIEQLQFTGEESTDSMNAKIKLNFNHPCKELIWTVQPTERRACGAGKDLFNYAASGPGGVYGDENNVRSAKLQLNGHDRFSEQPGKYFDRVQPYQHHTRTPARGVNVYSFGLKPEEHQPSGTCNMSRIDNATLNLSLRKAAMGASGSAVVRVYATNYNVLRVMSGMGGLAYSN